MSDITEQYKKQQLVNLLKLQSTEKANTKFDYDQLEQQRLLRMYGGGNNNFQFLQGNVSTPPVAGVSLFAKQPVINSEYTGTIFQDPTVGAKYQGQNFDASMYMKGAADERMHELQVLENGKFQHNAAQGNGRTINAEVNIPFNGFR